MLKTISITALTIGFIFMSCGPAAESRERMDAIAKQISDSIQRSVDSIMKQPLTEMAPAALQVSTVTTMPEASVKRKAN